MCIRDSDKAMKNGLDLSRIEGFHFHTLCEQDSDALETTLAAVAEKFGDLLYGLCLLYTSRCV